MTHENLCVRSICHTINVRKRAYSDLWGDLGGQTEPTQRLRRVFPLKSTVFLQNVTISRKNMVKIAAEIDREVHPAGYTKCRIVL